MSEHSYRGDESYRGNDKNSSYRTGKEIEKIYDKINENERRSGLQKLRMRAVCRHTQDANNPSLVPHKNPDGTTTWYCRRCREKIDLRTISDAKIDEAIATITDMCNFIKIMSRPKKDDRLVAEIVSDVQYKLNAFIKGAYKSAVEGSKRKKGSDNKYRSKAGTAFYVTD